MGSLCQDYSKTNHIEDGSTDLWDDAHFVCKNRLSTARFSFCLRDSFGRREPEIKVMHIDWQQLRFLCLGM